MARKKEKEENNLYIIGDTEEFSDLDKINRKYKNNLISLGDIRGRPAYDSELFRAVRGAKTYWKDKIPDEVWEWFHKNQADGLKKVLERLENEMTVLMGNGDTHFAERLEKWGYENPYQHEKLKTIYEPRFEIKGNTGIFYIPHNDKANLDKLLEEAKGKKFDYVLVLMHEPPIDDSQQPVQRKNYQFFKRLVDFFKDKKITAVHGHMHTKESRHYKIGHADVYEPRQRGETKNIFDAVVYDLNEGKIQIRSYQDKEVKPAEITPESLHKSKRKHEASRQETQNLIERVRKLSLEMGFDLKSTEKDPKHIEP